MAFSTPTGLRNCPGSKSGRPRLSPDLTLGPGDPCQEGTVLLDYGCCPAPLADLVSEAVSQVAGLAPEDFVFACLVPAASRAEDWPTSSSGAS